MGYYYSVDKEAEKYSGKNQFETLICIKKGAKEIEQYEKILTALTDRKTNEDLKSIAKEHKNKQKEYIAMKERLDSIQEKDVKEKKAFENIVKGIKAGYYGFESELLKVNVNNPQEIIKQQKMVDEIVGKMASKGVKVEDISVLTHTIISIKIDSGKWKYENYIKTIEEEFISEFKKINPFLSIDLISLSSDVNYCFKDGKLSVDETILNCDYKQIKASEFKEKKEKEMQKEIKKIPLSSIEILESLMKHKIEKSHIADSLKISEKAIGYIMKNLKEIKTEKKEEELKNKKKVSTKRTVS